MAKKVLGKVAITTGGLYSPQSAYDKLTIVTYNGASYISARAVPAGVTPDDITYWQLVAEKGDKGADGPQGNSGFTGAAEELEVVNNLTQGGATAALSAEQGKIINSKLINLDSNSYKVIRRNGLLSYAPAQIEGYIPKGATIYNNGILVLIANDNSLAGRIDLARGSSVTLTEDKRYFQTLTEEGDLDLLIFFKPSDMLTPSDLYFVPRRITKNEFPSYTSVQGEVLPKGATIYNYGIPIFVANDNSLAGRIDIGRGEIVELDVNKSLISSLDEDGDLDFVVNYPNKLQKIDTTLLEKEVADLANRVNEATEEYVHDEIVNPSYNWSVGFMDVDGQISAYENYRYSEKISVYPGDTVINVRVSDSTVANSVRVITAFAGNNAVIDKGLSSGGEKYVVPEGVDSIVITIDNNILLAYGNKTIINRSGKRILAKGVREVQNKVACLYNKNGVWREYTDSIIGGNELILAKRLDIKKGCQYNVNFKFVGAFDDNTTISIGCGVDGYMSSRLIIDKSNIYTYISGSQYKTFDHGLTFSQFLSVNLDISSTALNGSASIRINTLGGEYVVNASNDTYFPNCNGKIFFRPSIDVTDVIFAYSVTDLAYDTIVFGDSYISLADANRWPYYMMSRDNHRFALCGFGGARSIDAIESFREILYKKMPKYVVWALGMNDADGSSSVNSSWLECVEEVRDWCSKNDRELILCTIPNVPTISHIYKNDYVRNSGNRYIDFAKAVNAEGAGASWYNGMLSSDGVHPTEVGARSLYYRILLDFPEITNW